MQLGYAPGSLPSVGIYTTPFFAAFVQQTINPPALVIQVNGSQVFTTNLPAVWTVVNGTIVAAPDGLSATYTAPGSTGSDTVTATNEIDPSNFASAPVTIIAAPTVVENTLVGYYQIGRAHV